MLVTRRTKKRKKHRTRGQTKGAKLGATPKKRQAGQGSQRVRNKAKKSDVKKMWHEAGWDPKPAWLTWRRALEWLKKGEQPPKKRPISSPQERAKFAALLSAHQYTRDDQGNIIPPTGSTSSSSSATPMTNLGTAQLDANERGRPLPNQEPGGQPVHGEHEQRLQAGEQGGKSRYTSTA